MSYTIANSVETSGAYTFTNDCFESLSYAVSVQGESSVPSWLTQITSSDTIQVQTNTIADAGIYAVDVVGTAVSGVSDTLTF